MLLPGAPVCRPRKAGSKHDLLHKVVREHLSELVSECQERGRPLRGYVVRELEGFLACGRPEGGFTWYRCPNCEHSRVLPFSCKCSSVCPSCGGRHMNQLAANLVDHVLPHVAVRQWVLTFPFPVRFWLAWRPKLRTRVLSLFLEEVQSWYRESLVEPQGEGGSVTVWQLAGSALNLNPHIHALVLDGLYVWDADAERPVFRYASRPGRKAMAGLVKRIRLRVLSLLEAEGLLGEEVVAPDDDTAQLELVEEGMTRQPARVRGAEPREAGASRGRCHAWADWYDLHANVRIRARDRAGLERLCRYVGRPPLSRERLREQPDGRIALRLKSSWGCAAACIAKQDGTTHLVFRPLELVRKLAALVPHPRFNLVVYHGVLAGNHRWRSMVVPPRPPSSEEGEPPKRRRRSAWIPWQELMKRTFGVNVLLCPRCQTLMVLRSSMYCAASGPWCARMK